MSFFRKAGESVVPCKAFFLSRAGLFILVYLFLVFFPAQKGRQYWHAFHHNRFLDGWARFDAGWYGRIARFGYKNITVGHGQDTNFFPLYPIAVRGLARVLGNVFLAGIVVSNLCFLLALIGLYHLARKRAGPDVARRCVYLLAFNPFSFYFSAVYTEALFLFFVIYAFFFCERRRYLLAGLLAAGAGATRNIGVFTSVGLGLLALEQARQDGKGLKPGMAWIFLGLGGSLSYMAFLWVRFGDPLLFLHAQKAWGSFNPSELLRYTFRTLRYASPMKWGYPLFFIFHVLLGLAAVFLVVKEWRFLGVSYTLFSLLLILPAFLRFTSLGRYLIVVFPLFVALGKVTGAKRTYLVVLSLESALLVIFTFMFSHWYWVA